MKGLVCTKLQNPAGDRLSASGCNQPMRVCSDDRMGDSNLKSCRDSALHGGFFELDGPGIVSYRLRCHGGGHCIRSRLG